MNTIPQQALLRLKNWLFNIGRCTVAVSGGIDSMLMAYVANQCLGQNALIVHSTSPAVPSADCKRVQEYASRYSWNYQQVISREADSDNYQSNPVNRCYYCKSSLYLNLRHLNHGQVITGTNMDDLGDYRPGLIAAKEQEIRHPYIDCDISKSTIRSIARYLGLSDLQDLPASPCLASRVETGIRIVPEQLSLIDRVENYVRQTIASETIRFRIRQSALVLELDHQTLEQLTSEQTSILTQKIEYMTKQCGLTAPLQFSGYQRGSAFVGDKNNMGYIHV